MSTRRKQAQPVQSMGPDLIPTLVVAAGHLQSEIAKQLGALSAHWGLTFAKLRVLHCIAISEGQMTCADIGRAIGASRQSALKQATLLEEQGLLARTDNPMDARAPLFHLSPKGQQVFNELAAIWSAHNDILSTELARLRMQPNDVLTCIATIKSVTKAMKLQRLEWEDPS